MTYQRKRFSSQGNTAAWVFLLLAAVLGFLLWAKTRGDTADFSSIIPQTTTVNNTQTAQAESTQSAALDCPGMTLYGVQSGSFSDREAAEGSGLAVWADGDAYRALRSVWTSREAALAAATEADYVAKLVIPALSLHLSGREADIAAVQEALEAWEEVLKEGAELQDCWEKLSPETREAWLLRLKNALSAAGETLPGGEAMRELKSTLESSAAALEKSGDWGRTLAELYAAFAQYGAGLVD